MQFSLYSQTYGAIHFKPVASASLPKYIMAGGKVRVAVGAFGKILSREMTAGDVHLTYIICKIKQDLALDFTTPRHLWLTHIALKNESRFDIGSEDACLKQGQYNMTRGSVRGTFYMEKGNEYEAITITCDHRKLPKLLPRLKSISNRLDPHKKRLLFRKPGLMDQRLTSTVHHILLGRYRADRHQLSFDYEINKLLLSLFNKQNEANKAIRELHDRTTEVIKEVKHFIKSGLNHHMTLYKIAKQIGTNKVRWQDGSG